jgi:uncharacterized membrane protein
MQRVVDPIITRFKLLPRPLMFKAPPHEGQAPADTPFGQMLAERVAGAIGSWGFIGAQGIAMAVWVVINTLVFFHAIRFDAYPFVFLNLAMSAEAAFTGPILLIAANVGAIRDHRQYDRIEHLTAKTEDLGEKSQDMASRLVEIERQMDVHISQSLRAHTQEIQELCDLVRAMHAVVVSSTGQTAAAAEANAPSTETLSTVADAAPEATPAATADAPAPRRSTPRSTKRQ